MDLHTGTRNSIKKVKKKMPPPYIKKLDIGGHFFYFFDRISSFCDLRHIVQTHLLILIPLYDKVLESSEVLEAATADF